MSSRIVALRYLARCYIDAQQLRISIQLRMQRLVEQGYSRDDPLIKMMERWVERWKSLEQQILDEAAEYFEGTPLWQWCLRVKGLGRVAALMFYGYIDPYKATTAGKALAYTGLTPESKLRAGVKARFNPLLKGRFGYLIPRNVIMKRDPYYYPIYLAKKEYYLKKRGFEEFARNPRLCPRYEECMRRLAAKAQRLGRPMKHPACLAHADGMARRFLARILLSHATELMRLGEGLPVDNFKSHRNYIPPKPEGFTGTEPWFQRILENLREGRRERTAAD